MKRSIFTDVSRVLYTVVENKTIITKEEISNGLATHYIYSVFGVDKRTIVNCWHMCTTQGASVNVG